MTSTVDRPAPRRRPVEQQGQHDAPADPLGAVRDDAGDVRGVPVLDRSSPTPCPRSSPTCAARRASTPGSSRPPCWPRRRPPRSGASSPTCSARSCCSSSSIVIFIVGSMLAGLSQSVETLIAWRVLQGLGLGGLQALVQIAMAAMISPRERGRYSGLLGSVMAVATVGGPLLGGLLVDTSWLGWRWCFYVGVPFAARRPGPAAAHPAPAGDQAGGAHRLPRRRVPDRRCLRAAHLGHPGRRQLRLGLDRDGVVRRRRRRSRSSPSSGHRDCGRRSRSSRCGCSATGRRRWPSSPASRSAWRCSGRRSSSASTCRSPAATRPRPPAC